jgi:hypothetical protein
MKNVQGNRGGGLIKTVLVIVIVLIVLGYFGYNLRDILDKPAVNENLSTVWNWIETAWHWLLGLLPNRTE